MPQASEPANSVMDLLAKSSAPTSVDGTLMSRPRARPLVAQYDVGRPGSGRLAGAMVPRFIGAGFVLISVIVALSALRGSELAIYAVMGIGLLLVIATSIAGDGLKLEVIGLRHRETAGAFHVGSTQKDMMGYMSFSKMVMAHREGRNRDVMAAI